MAERRATSPASDAVAALGGVHAGEGTARRTSTPAACTRRRRDALQNARDVYARRGEAVSIWVVPSAAIVASSPEDAGPFFDPADDKPYRHPQFYKMPRGVRVE